MRLQQCTFEVVIVLIGISSGLDKTFTEDYSRPCSKLACYFSTPSISLNEQSLNEQHRSDTAKHLRCPLVARRPNRPVKPWSNENENLHLLVKSRSHESAEPTSTMRFGVSQPHASFQQTPSNIFQGRVTRAGLIGNVKAAKSSKKPLRPDEVLFKRKNAPVRYEEDDYYPAHRRLPPGQELPSGDLAAALHANISRLYAKTERPGMHRTRKPMDETALIALSILMEETARGVLGETGDLAFTEAVSKDEERVFGCQVKQTVNREEKLIPSGVGGVEKASVGYSGKDVAEEQDGWSSSDEESQDDSGDWE